MATITAKRGALVSPSLARAWATAEATRSPAKPECAPAKPPLAWPSLSAPPCPTVLGIDPGLRVTGYAVLTGPPGGVGRPGLREAGAIRSHGDLPLEARLAELHRGVAEVIAEFAPDVVAAEKLFSHYAHPRTAILMGHARGVIFLAAAAAGIPVVGYSPSRIKKDLTGDGRANKPQMQQAVAAALSLAAPPEPHDVADAIAVALCHLHTFGLAR